MQKVQERENFRIILGFKKIEYMKEKTTPY